MVKRVLSFLPSAVCILILLSGCTIKSTLPLETTYLPRVSGIMHTVEKGQTLWRISKIYNVDLDKIVKVNRISDKTKIGIGRDLLIPGAKEKKKIYTSSSNKNLSFIWPVKGEITSYFTEKKDHIINKGINIKAKLGTNVLSSRAGIVCFLAENLKGYGKTIFIDHQDGFVTVYAHNSESLVKLNARVKQGAVIAKVGKGGRIDVPALHFQIRKGTRPKNPLHYLP